MLDLDSKHAVLVNFTGNSYHWGCHGTSLELYRTLTERGYYIEIVDVAKVHSLAPTPKVVEDYDSEAFLKSWVGANPELTRALANADVVIVNGEGTLHRSHNAPLNLLFLMAVAKRALGRKVHLVNHSFFPNGDDAPNAVLDRIYGGVARVLDHVVPREPLSKAVLERLSVPATQGFDCLPRFIERHGLAGSASRSAGIVVSGGVAFTPETCAALGKMLKRVGRTTHPVRFLTGAKANPAREDMAIFTAIRSEFPELQLADAGSMRAWLDCIGSACCLVSGRYHHSLAAAALGVPFVVFPSNTPKIGATLEMLDYAQAQKLPTETDFAAIESFIQDSLAGKTSAVSSEAMKRALALSANNFDGL
jgi:polysaccharide pyruvyl transferase WcaK-like protein